MASTRPTPDGQAGEVFLTVAICTRNRAASLLRAVESVRPQLDVRTELLIVDNGSTDDTGPQAEALATRQPCIRVLCEPTPGIAVARNTALAQARGEHVVFFDDDELAEPGWLDAYRDFLRQPPSDRLGGVGGPYLAQHESPVPWWLGPDYGSFQYDAGRQPMPHRGNLAGGNCAYPRKVALQAGGFATELIRHEDTELNDRLRAAGYELWWLPEARVRHIIPASRCRLGAQMRLWFVDGREVVKVRLRKKKSPRMRGFFLLGRLVVMPAQLVAQVVGAILCGLVCRRWAAARLLFRAARSAGFLRQLLRESLW